jgi:hypothetical protein
VTRSRPANGVVSRRLIEAALQMPSLSSIEKESDCSLNTNTLSPIRCSVHMASALEGGKVLSAARLSSIALLIACKTLKVESTYLRTSVSYPALLCEAFVVAFNTVQYESPRRANANHLTLCDVRSLSPDPPIYFCSSRYMLLVVKQFARKLYVNGVCPFMRSQFLAKIARLQPLTSRLSPYHGRQKSLHKA